MKGLNNTEIMMNNGYNKVLLLGASIFLIFACSSKSSPKSIESEALSFFVSNLLEADHFFDNSSLNIKKEILEINSNVLNINTCFAKGKMLKLEKNRLKLVDFNIGMNDKSVILDDDLEKKIKNKFTGKNSIDIIIYETVLNANNEYVVKIECKKDNYKVSEYLVYYIFINKKSKDVSWCYIPYLD